jgi:hypothetical protein
MDLPNLAQDEDTSSSRESNRGSRPQPLSGSNESTEIAPKIVSNLSSPDVVLFPRSQALFLAPRSRLHRETAFGMVHKTSKLLIPTIDDSQPQGPNTSQESKSLPNPLVLIGLDIESRLPSCVSRLKPRPSQRHESMYYEVNAAKRRRADSFVSLDIEVSTGPGLTFVSDCDSGSDSDENRSLKDEFLFSIDTIDRRPRQKTPVQVSKPLAMRRPLSTRSHSAKDPAAARTTMSLSMSGSSAFSTTTPQRHILLPRIGTHDHAVASRTPTGVCILQI